MFNQVNAGWVSIWDFFKNLKKQTSVYSLSSIIYGFLCLIFNFCMFSFPLFTFSLFSSLPHFPWEEYYSYSDKTMLPLYAEDAGLGLSAELCGAYEDGA